MFFITLENKIKMSANIRQYLAFVIQSAFLPGSHNSAGITGIYQLWSAVLETWHLGGHVNFHLLFSALCYNTLWIVDCDLQHETKHQQRKIIQMRKLVNHLLYVKKKTNALAAFKTKHVLWKVCENLLSCTSVLEVHCFSVWPWDTFSRTHMQWNPRKSHVTVTKASWIKVLPVLQLSKLINL